jgi:hypothetical protein
MSRRLDSQRTRPDGCGRPTPSDLHSDRLARTGTDSPEYLTGSAGGVIVGSGGPRSRCRSEREVVAMSDHRCVGAWGSFVVDAVRGFSHGHSGSGVPDELATGGRGSK